MSGLRGVRLNTFWGNHLQIFNGVPVLEQVDHIYQTVIVIITRVYLWCMESSKRNSLNERALSKLQEEWEKIRDIRVKDLYCVHAKSKIMSNSPANHYSARSTPPCFRSISYLTSPILHMSLSSIWWYLMVFTKLGSRLSTCNLLVKRIFLRFEPVTVFTSVLIMMIHISEHQGNVTYMHLME